LSLTQYCNLAPHGDSFTQLDEKKHTFRRRMISGIFSMSQVREGECYVDNVTQCWSPKLNSNYSSIIDLCWTMQYSWNAWVNLLIGVRCLI